MSRSKKLDTQMKELDFSAAEHFNKVIAANREKELALKMQRVKTGKKRSFFRPRKIRTHAFTATVSVKAEKTTFFAFITSSAFKSLVKAIGTLFIGTLAASALLVSSIEHGTNYDAYIDVMILCTVVVIAAMAYLKRLHKEM